MLQLHLKFFERNTMKALKLSLAAAIAATSLTSLNAATALEESLKDIDVGGVLRYRYDSYRTKDVGPQEDSQNHKIRAQVGAKGYLSDNIAAVGVIDYNYDGNANDSGFGPGSKANTGESFHLREAYVQYEAPDFGTTIKAGRQQLNTIWTDNGIEGSVGMKGQIFNNSIKGLTLTAFAVDSVNDDPDFVGSDISKVVYTPYTNNTLKDFIFAQNIYGAAGLLDYAEDFGVTGGLWLAYVPNRATLYAVDGAYSYTFANNITWGIQGQYLGNSVDNFLENALGPNTIKNGNLFTVAGTLEAFGFDGSLGYTQYGNKTHTTFNVLEDMGDIITAGEEIQNLTGSSLHGSLGKNQFVFGALGYTIADKVRLGVDYVYGGTKIDNGFNTRLGKGAAGKKQEIVGRINYQYTDKLEFYTHYSYVTHKNQSGIYEGNKLKQNNIRLQAKYEF